MPSCLSYAPTFWAMPSFLSYAATFWAMPSCLSYASTFWAMPSFLSYAATFWAMFHLSVWAMPPSFWGTSHPSELWRSYLAPYPDNLFRVLLNWTALQNRTLLSDTKPFSAPLCHCTLLTYAAPFWAISTLLWYIRNPSNFHLSDLLLTFCATSQSSELCRTLLSYKASFLGTPHFDPCRGFLSWSTLSWAAPHSSVLCQTLLSYAGPFQAMLHPTELRLVRIFLSYTAPFWTMPHPFELNHILLCCVALRALLGYVRPSWATFFWATHSQEYFWATILGALLSCVAPLWTYRHPSELCSFLLSFARLLWATLHPSELRHTLYV
jgi:hypothetical protein